MKQEKESVSGNIFEAHKYYFLSRKFNNRRRMFELTQETLCNPKAQLIP